MAMPTHVVPYDPKFLGGGFSVPLPSLSPALTKTAYRGGLVLDYVHFSIVLSQTRKMALYSACNIDAERKVSGIGRDGVYWRPDERAADAQLTESVYKKTAWDHGHLTRREDVLWGTRSVARAANEATFYMTNATPQHYRFNQDEWLALEDWVLDIATDLSYKLCVFTGPVLSDKDPLWFPAKRGLDPHTIRVPAAFWKLIVLRDERAAGNDLAAIAFAMRQTEMWDDDDGAKMMNLKVHQVPLKTIEKWTGLSFGSLKNADELAWSSSRQQSKKSAAPIEFPVITQKSDLRLNGNERRSQGLRISPTENRTTRALHDQGHADGNLYEEIAALRARIDVLEDLAAAQRAKTAETPHSPA